jgi:hypothetical protein
VLGLSPTEFYTALRRQSDDLLSIHLIRVLAAHYLCGSYMSFPLAMSISASIRVGNLLGTGLGQQARYNNPIPVVHVDFESTLLLQTSVLSSAIFKDSRRIDA